MKFLGILENVSDGGLFLALYINLEQVLRPINVLN